MYIDEIEAMFSSREGVSIGFPFGETILVMKLVDKIFLLSGIDDDPLRVNLKATPENVIEYIETYSACIPAYHMNKKHWFTVILDGSISNAVLKTMMEDSYQLIGNALPKKSKEIINWETK